ncbi:THUMP domain containing protein [Gracilaria domingensis]|nr:THUMP domain containing protein [Gracilaria domingensis]
MGTSVPQKRAAPSNGALSSRQRRRKFRRAGVPSVKRADLTQARHGVLVSCTPGHEQHAFRDAVVLLSRFVEAGERADGAEGGGVAGDGADGRTESALERELTALRKGEDQVFTRVVPDVKGAVFLRVNDAAVDVERVVEQALLEARQSGSAGSRHCIRVIPVRATCYANAETAAAAALAVVKERFPPAPEKGSVSFAIVFRARLNHSAKREQFIEAIAAAIHEFEPRYKVDLTTPDVVLIVEVLKTSCCIGAFTKFYQLAKLNLREAACPSKPKEAGAKEGGHKSGGEQAADSAAGDGGEKGAQAAVVGGGKGKQATTAGEEEASDGVDGGEQGKQAAVTGGDKDTDGVDGGANGGQATTAGKGEATDDVDGRDEGKQAAAAVEDKATDGVDGGEKGAQAVGAGGNEATGSVDGGEGGDE